MAVSLKKDWRVGLEDSLREALEYWGIEVSVTEWVPFRAICLEAAVRDWDCLLDDNPSMRDYLMGRGAERLWATVESRILFARMLDPDADEAEARRQFVAAELDCDDEDMDACLAGKVYDLVCEWAPYDGEFFRNRFLEFYAGFKKDHKVSVRLDVGTGTVLLSFKMPEGESRLVVRQDRVTGGLGGFFGLIGLDV